MLFGAKKRGRMAQPNNNVPRSDGHELGLGYGDTPACITIGYHFLQSRTVRNALISNDGIEMSMR